MDGLCGDVEGHSVRIEKGIWVVCEKGFQLDCAERETFLRVGKEKKDS
jgi:hypothetical protein